MIKALLITCMALFAVSLHAEGDAPRILAELEASYPTPPPGKNAAGLFQEGASLLVIHNEEYGANVFPLPPPAGVSKGNQPLPLTMSNMLAAVVGRNASALAQFRKASLLSESKYPIDWSLGAETPLPHLSQTCTKSALFLKWCSLRFAVEGKGDQAVESILLGLSLARSLENEPLLVSQAVRDRCRYEAFEGLKETLHRVSLTMESLETLQKTIGEMEQHESEGASFSRAIAGHKILAASLCDSPLTNQVRMLMWRDYGQEMGETNLQHVLARDAKIDRQFLFETLDEIGRLWAKPYPERLKALRYYRMRCDEAVNRKLMLSRNFLECYLHVEAEMLIELRFAIIAVALERYRLEHYKLYPPFLSHLTPKYLKTVPLDPFDGKPIRYLKVARGYKAYSSAGTNYSRADLSFSVSAGPQ